MTSAYHSRLKDDSGDARVTAELAGHTQKWPEGASIDDRTLSESLGLLVTLSDDERAIVLSNSLALAKAFAGRCRPS